MHVCLHSHTCSADLGSLRTPHLSYTKAHALRKACLRKACPAPTLKPLGYGPFTTLLPPFPPPPARPAGAYPISQEYRVKNPDPCAPPPHTLPPPAGAVGDSPPVSCVGESGLSYPSNAGLASQEVQHGFTIGLAFGGVTCSETAVTRSRTCASTPPPPSSGQQQQQQQASWLPFNYSGPFYTSCSLMQGGAWDGRGSGRFADSMLGGGGRGKVFRSGFLGNTGLR